MTTEQLESVIAATGHDRFRWLTSGANPDPVSREGYRRLVRDRAEALIAAPPSYPLPPQPPEPPPAEPNAHLALLKLARACPHAGPASCGCNSVRRCARYNRDVAMSECLACVRDGGLEGDPWVTTV